MHAETAVEKQLLRRRLEGAAAARQLPYRRIRRAAGSIVAVAGVRRVVVSRHRCDSRGPAGELRRAQKGRCGNDYARFVLRSGQLDKEARQRNVAGAKLLPGDRHALRTTQPPSALQCTTRRPCCSRLHGRAPRYTRAAHPASSRSQNARRMRRHIPDNGSRAGSGSHGLEDNALLQYIVRVADVHADLCAQCQPRRAASSACSAMRTFQITYAASSSVKKDAKKVTKNWIKLMGARESDMSAS